MFFLLCNHHYLFGSHSFEAALHCKSISFWRDSVLWIAWTEYARLLWLQCCCRARITLSSWELHRQVHRVYRKKKKKREILLGTKIKVLKLLILNVSMSFVFFWTIFGLLPWRLASLGISGCFFFFLFPLLLLPPFLVVVRPYHFSLLVQKDVNSVAVWAWPGASTLLETC